MNTIRKISRWSVVVLLATIVLWLCVEFVFSLFGKERREDWRAQAQYHHQYAKAKPPPLTAHRIKTSLQDFPDLNSNPEYRLGGFYQDHSPVDYSLKDDVRLWRDYPGQTPNSTFHSILKYKDGRPIRDIEIHTDEFGRRLTLNPHLAARASHALMLGCSYTFGEGLSENQTLPSQLAREATAHHFYNYGVQAAGPMEVLRQMREYDLKKQISEKNGIAIYTFIPDHLRRMKPSLSFMFPHADFVYFEQNTKGEWQRYANFRVAHPYESFFLDLLSHSNVLHYFGNDLYPRSNEGDYRAVAQILKQIGIEYQRQLGPQNHFYVVLFPEDLIPNSLGAYLDEAQVDYLDYSRVDMARKVLHRWTTSEVDGHPSDEVNALLAKAIAKDLKLN